MGSMGSWPLPNLWVGEYFIWRNEYCGFDTGHPASTKSNNALIVRYPSAAGIHILLHLIMLHFRFEIHAEKNTEKTYLTSPDTCSKIWGCGSWTVESTIAAGNACTCAAVLKQFVPVELPSLPVKSPFPLEKPPLRFRWPSSPAWPWQWEAHRVTKFYPNKTTRSATYVTYVISRLHQAVKMFLHKRLRCTDNSATCSNFHT